MSHTPKAPPFSVAPERMPPLTAEKMTAQQKAVAAELAAGRRGSVRGPFTDKERRIVLAEKRRAQGFLVSATQ